MKREDEKTKKEKRKKEKREKGWDQRETRTCSARTCRLLWENMLNWLSRAAASGSATSRTWKGITHARRGTKQQQRAQIIKRRWGI